MPNLKRFHLLPLLALVLPSAILALPSAILAQDRTLPPPPTQPVLTLHATGVQIYTCQQVGSHLEWTFLAPSARLFDDAGNEVATHGDGPVWNYQDSSSVQGVVLETTASPDPGSIPWLLLKAVNPQRTGVLTRVDYIRRSDTHGGIAPTSGCDADHRGDLIRAPYTATYTFYSARP